MKVFLSSTALDLVAYRKVADDTILRMSQEAVVTERFGSLPGEPAAECERKARECDVTVCVVAHRYGFVPDKGRGSITRREVEAAKAAGREVLVWIVADDYAWAEKKEQDLLTDPTVLGDPVRVVEVAASVQALLDFKAWLRASYVCEAFTTPDDLGRKIAIALGASARRASDGQPTAAATRALNRGEISPDGSSALLDPALRGLLLDKVQTQLIDERLGTGLREAIRVDLGLTEAPGEVGASLLDYARLESGEIRERLITVAIQEFFKQKAGSRLLILGEPGTGKTNLLLELAASLIAEAKHEPALPIPVVFSLSRWTLGKQVRNLGDWLKDDLASESWYGVSRAAADALVRQDRILPLLDGLDEVDPDRRAACVEAIHEYQRTRKLGPLGPLAVCCRMEEYEDQDLPKLDLGAALRVQRLTHADVERETAKPGLEKTREALLRDPQLWEVIDTPLWLHVLYLAAQIDSPEGLKVESGDIQAARDRLYARFVEYALERTPKDSPRRRTAREPLLRCLDWLAAEMRRRNQAQFALEELDASWLASRRAQRAVPWLVGLVAGLIGGLLGGLGFGLFFGLLGGLLVGLVGELGGPLVGLYRKPEVIEELHFSWRAFGQGLRSGLLVGLGGGLLVGPASVLGIGLGAGLTFEQFVRLHFGLDFGLGIGLLLGPVFGLLFGLLGALQPRAMSVRSAPNRGTQRSLRYALRIAGASLALAMLTVGVSRRLFPPDVLGFSGWGFLFTVGGVVLAFAKGGGFALRHYALRLLLWCQGVAPLRYVRFLNEAARRLFLIRRGGNYEFFHLTFRDYMATAYRPASNAGSQTEAEIE